jgi:hypothetical protein
VLVIQLSSQGFSDSPAPSATHAGPLSLYLLRCRTLRFPVDTSLQSASDVFELADLGEVFWEDVDDRNGLLDFNAAVDDDLLCFLDFLDVFYLEYAAGPLLTDLFEALEPLEAGCLM